MLQCIFFDVGGTLLTLDWNRIAKLLENPSLANKLAQAETAGRDAIDHFRQEGLTTDGSTYFGAILDKINYTEQKRETVLQKLWSAHLENNFWQCLRPEAKPTLHALSSQGFKLGVISNSEGKLKALLEKTGLTHFFSVILDSGQEGIEKPVAEFFLRACHQIQVLPQNTLYIGDLYSVDILGALGVGMKAVLLAPSTYHTQKLPENAYRISNLSALTPLVLSLQKPR